MTDMKIARLDQILYRLGYVADEQIKQALQRQKSHRGRLGTHLLFFKFINEEQLAHALSLQHQVPAFIPSEHKISKSIIKRFSVALAEKHQVLPINCSPDGKILTLIVADPEDTRAIEAARHALHCTDVNKYVTPESVLRNIITQCYRREDKDPDVTQIIELPELFNEESDTLDESTLCAVEGENPDIRKVLMVSRTIFLKNFLCPIFERDGYNLSVLSDREDISSMLQQPQLEHVLVSPDMAEEYDSWIRRAKIPIPQAEVTKFSTVSGALIENPVPYDVIIQSLFRSMQIIAEMRSSECMETAPYDLMRKDIDNLAGSVGLTRLAVDGLQIAVLLLVPQWDPCCEISTLQGERNHSFFIDIDKSLEYARSLRFPWSIEDVLSAFLELLSERRNPDEANVSDKDIALAAQVLVLVWYRHISIRTIKDSPEENIRVIKSGLREKSGRLARSEVVETYIRLIEQSENLFTAPYHQLFLVGTANQTIDRFATRLKHLGYRIVATDSLKEAEQMCERLSPTAIFVYDECYPEEIFECSELFRHTTSVLLYAITSECNPSHTLNLFDAGFDDVFIPPHDFDIIAARVNKSIKGITQAEPMASKQGGFSASFKAFAFTDLIQALGQSLKSVHINLVKGSGEKADIYMNQGKIVCATCGEMTGAEVIYHIITWEEDGAFTVEPAEQFPEGNISVSNDAILMEGVRLLDESRI